MAMLCHVSLSKTSFISKRKGKRFLKEGRSWSVQKQGLEGLVINTEVSLDGRVHDF